jgi:cytochrome b6-f complex iron-sulfur subunit
MCIDGEAPRCVAACGPVSVPTIGRRTFIARSTLLAAAAALAACGGADSTSPTLNAGASINVNDYSALSNVGGIATVTVSGARLAIVRTGATSFLALSRVCPHQGGTIGVSGNGFRCPEHGATFDSTGKWIGGERTSNMHAYTTSYDAATGILSLS